MVTTMMQKTPGSCRPHVISARVVSTARLPRVPLPTVRIGSEPDRGPYAGLGTTRRDFRTGTDPRLETSTHAPALPLLQYKHIC